VPEESDIGLWTSVRGSHERDCKEALGREILREEEHERSMFDQMTEDTEQFLIKFLAVGAVIVALYFAFSPYRTCMRNNTDNADLLFVAQTYCNATTSW